MSSLSAWGLFLLSLLKTFGQLVPIFYAKRQVIFHFADSLIPWFSPFEKGFLTSVYTFRFWGAISMRAEKRPLHKNINHYKRVFERREIRAEVKRRWKVRCCTQCFFWVICNFLETDLVPVNITAQNQPFFSCKRARTWWTPRLFNRKGCWYITKIYNLWHKNGGWLKADFQGSSWTYLRGCQTGLNVPELQTMLI